MRLKYLLAAALSISLAHAQTSVGGGPDGFDELDTPMLKMKYLDESISRVVQENSEACLGNKNKLKNMNLPKVHELLSEILIKSSMKYFSLDKKKNILNCPEEEYEKITCLVKGTEKDIARMVENDSFTQYMSEKYKTDLSDSILMLDYFKRIKQIP